MAQNAIPLCAAPRALGQFDAERLAHALHQRGAFALGEKHCRQTKAVAIGHNNTAARGERREAGKRRERDERFNHGVAPLGGSKKDRRADLGLEIAISQRIVHKDVLSDALGTTCQEAKTNPVPQHRRERDRCDVALVIFQGGVFATSQQVCARAQAPRSVEGLETDKGRPLDIAQAGTGREHAADIVLLGGHHLAQPEVRRRGHAVQLVSRDVALFDAHHAKRFSAIRRHARGRGRRS